MRHDYQLLETGQIGQQRRQGELPELLEHPVHAAPQHGQVGLQIGGPVDTLAQLEPEPVQDVAKLRRGGNLSVEQNSVLV